MCMKEDSRIAIRCQGALKEKVELEAGFTACFQTEGVSEALDRVINRYL